MLNFRARKEKLTTTNVNLTRLTPIDPLLKGLFNKEFPIISKGKSRSWAPQRFFPRGGGFPPSGKASWGAQRMDFSQGFIGYLTLTLKQSLLFQSLKFLFFGHNQVTITMDFDETWWKRILQTSRSFLNQNFRNQNGGKPKFKGQKFRDNPQNFNDSFHVSVLVFPFFCFFVIPSWGETTRRGLTGLYGPFKGL